MLGENLAWGTGALATPRSIMQAWMNSAGHRQNILNREFREFGVGVAAGNPSARDGLGATYANEFGVLQGATQAPQAPRAKTTAAKRKRARQARARHARRVRARASRAQGPRHPRAAPRQPLRTRWKKAGPLAAELRQSGDVI